MKMNQEQTAQWSNQFYNPYVQQVTEFYPEATHTEVTNIDCSVKRENNVVCRCDDCNIQFESVNSFNEHVYSTHRQDKMDRCIVCNTGWMSIGSLIEHNYDLHADGDVDNVGNDDAAEELEITRIMQEIDTLFEKENSVRDEDDFDIENFIFNEKDEQSLVNIENSFSDTSVENVSEKDMQSLMNIENSISDASMDNVSEKDVQSLMNIEKTFSDTSLENASEVDKSFDDTSVDNATEQEADSLLNSENSFIDASVDDISYNSIADDSIMDDMDDSGLTDPSDSDLKKEILKVIDEYKENHPESVDCETTKAEERNVLEELDKAEEKLKTALKSLDGNLITEIRYCCPMSGCEFKTSKAGLMSKDTAIHFRDDHGIKARDMTPGMFRFIKVFG
jgi:hypothetical protein